MKTMQLRGTKGTAFGAGVEHRRSEAEEAMVFCPDCKALQTVWLEGDTLMPTVKFTQSGNHIFHNCGAKHPCRLYFDR
jgi:hypothetical protein